MEAHEGARTSGLDRRNDKILRSKVERVGIWKCTRAGAYADPAFGFPFKSVYPRVRSCSLSIGV
jgi:hypothetical protein